MKSKTLKVQRIEFSYISPDGEITFDHNEDFLYIHKGYAVVDKETKKILKSTTNFLGFEIWKYRYNAINRLVDIEESCKSEEVA